MSKIYFISPVNYKTPDLFSTFTTTLLNNGHEITGNIHDADVVFFDMHTRIGEYDDMELCEVINREIPVVSFCEYDFGGMAKDSWPFYTEQQQAFFHALDGVKTIHFVRKMDKTVVYPNNVYPYEKTIMNVFDPVSKDELCNREFDICYIGNTSPQRERVCSELSKYFKCDFVLGQQKIPHQEWIERHRRAKFFLTADGGGFGDERPHQLITIAAMLRQKNTQLFQEQQAFTSLNCMQVSEELRDYEHATLSWYLKFPDLIYSIYESGISHMKKFYTPEFRANYILATLKQNNIL